MYPTKYKFMKMAKLVVDCYLPTKNKASSKLWVSQSIDTVILEQNF